MTRNSVTGNSAAAWGVRLACVDYIPTCSINRQSEIIETLRDWIDQGAIAGKLHSLESEHAMVTAAGAAASGGMRVFTASSSQGLLHATKMLYHVAGWRAPLVLVNISRELPGSTSLEPDHSDILAACDSGFLQIHCATCQEVLDSVLLAYRLAEHEDVQLPVLVYQDIFNLPFAREVVSIPNATTAKQFVGSYNTEINALHTDSRACHADATLSDASYSYFRFEMHLAAQRALAVYDELADEFADFFGRRYPAVDAYRSDDADYVFVMMGAFANKAKEAIDRLRDGGWKVGLLRPRLLQPFPHEKFVSLLQGKQAIAVIEQNISMGKGGMLHSALASALYGQRDVPAILASYIGSPGRSGITTQEFFEMASMLRNAVTSGESPSPRLLFTESKWHDRQKLQPRTHAGHSDRTC